MDIVHDSFYLPPCPIYRHLYCESQENLQYRYLAVDLSFPANSDWRFIHSHLSSLDLSWKKIFFQLATSAPHPPRGHSLLSVIHFDAPFISAHSNCQQNCHSFHGIVFALHLINSFSLHLQCTPLFLLQILGGAIRIEFVVFVLYLYLILSL